MSPPAGPGAGPTKPPPRPSWAPRGQGGPCWVPAARGDSCSRERPQGGWQDMGLCRVSATSQGPVKDAAASQRRSPLHGHGPQALPRLVGGSVQTLSSPKPALAGTETTGMARTGALPMPATVPQMSQRPRGAPQGRPCQEQREGLGERLGRPWPRDAPASRPFALPHTQRGPRPRAPRLHFPPSPSPAACSAALPGAYWKRKLLGRQRVQQGSFGEERLGTAAGRARLSMLPGPGPVTGSVCSQCR